MIIDDVELDHDEHHEQAAQSDVAGTAYRESMTSVDGFTRGSNGRIKFNKDTKKRRREDEDVEGDIEMADAEAGAKAKKAKRKQEVRLGHEFKAKVRLFMWLPFITRIVTDDSIRKRGVMLKREEWTPTPIFRYPKQPREMAEQDKKGLALPKKDDIQASLCTSTRSIFRFSSIQRLIVGCPEEALLPTTWFSPLFDQLVQRKNLGD